MAAPSRSITPAEQLEMIKRMDENNNKKSVDDCTEPSKQDLKVCFHSRYLVKSLLTPVCFLVNFTFFFSVIFST